MSKEGAKKINTVQALGLITVAVMFDLAGLVLNLIGLIPIIGQLIAWPVSILVNIVGIIVFAVWYFLLGFGWTNPKRLAAMFGGGLIELIPVLNALPGFTLAAIVTIVTVKAEETLGIKLPGGK